MDESTRSRSAEGRAQAGPDNETGAPQPLSDLAALAHEHGALLRCDAVQAVGKITVDVEALGVDLLTAACGMPTSR
ncbi:aminotransferase class V-fold PLP-dependent enzyme [Nonomuraea sp. AD125B]|uniref:aminotransferase class V-fold PLP-dependent enzyme n=1 Tax=Nonomuraea sp. AD125B TaxID=3242897 RepID=UPI0035277FCD